MIWSTIISLPCSKSWLLAYVKKTVLFRESSLGVGHEIIRNSWNSLDIRGSEKGVCLGILKALPLPFLSTLKHTNVSVLAPHHANHSQLFVLFSPMTGLGSFTAQSLAIPTALIRYTKFGDMQQGCFRFFILICYPTFYSWANTTLKQESCVWVCVGGLTTFIIVIIFFIISIC